MRPAMSRPVCIRSLSQTTTPGQSVSASSRKSSTISKTVLTGLAFALIFDSIPKSMGPIRRPEWPMAYLDRDGGIETADMLVSAVGLFNQPLVPDLPGRETFNGPQFHSSRWDHDCSLDGKIVAVDRHRRQCHSVRSRDRPRVGQLLVCQRSPQYVLPRDERPIHSANGLWERFDPEPIGLAFTSNRNAARDAAAPRV